MALWDYEKRVLEQMEAEFRREDPVLVTQMKMKEAGEADRISLSPRSIAVGAVCALAGLGVLVGAVSLGYSMWSILLGVVGFVLMVAGIWFALFTTKKTGGAARAKNKRSGSRWSRFIAGQERRWDDRRDER